MKLFQNHIIIDEIIQDINKINYVNNLPKDVNAKLKLLHREVYVISKEELKKILVKHANNWEDIPF